jgi:hypothetical protein
VRSAWQKIRLIKREKLNFSFAFTIDSEKCFLKRFVAFSD